MYDEDKNIASSNDDEYTGAQLTWRVVGFMVGVLIAAVVLSLLTWNVGVVGLAAACGAHVAHISVGTGIGAVFLALLLKGTFGSR